MPVNYLDYFENYKYIFLISFLKTLIKKEVASARFSTLIGLRFAFSS